MPRQSRADVDAREAVPVQREARHILFAEPQPDRYAVERPARTDGATREVEFVEVQHADADETLERGFEVLDLFPDELELIGGTVLGEHRPGAVVDHAARRGQRFDAHAIALRKVGEVVVALDLQPEQP